MALPKTLVILDERPDRMIHTSSVSQAQINAVNVGPWDAVTIYVDGYSGNDNGTQGLRSPRSARVDKTALLAEMSKVDGINKPKLFFYLCDYFHFDFTGNPQDTSNPQREVSLANMQTVAECIAAKGWLGYVEDNEQYTHDGKKLEPQYWPGMAFASGDGWSQQPDGGWNYWDASYGRVYKDRMPEALGYFYEMWKRMLTANPRLQIAAYHGPYAGCSQTPFEVAVGQIGYGFPGMTAWWASFVKAAADLSLVGSAKGHDLGEAYALSGPGLKTSVDYRINHTPDDVVANGWLDSVYLLQWPHLIDEGFMRGLYSDASPALVAADLALAATVANGWIGIYPEDRDLIVSLDARSRDYLAGWKQFRGIA